MKIFKLERQDSDCLPNLPTTATPTGIAGTRDGTATAPGTIAGSALPEPTVGKKGKRGKNRNALFTITSASHPTTKPSTGELQQHPEPTSPVPQISIPLSPSVSSSIGSSRLTTGTNTPVVARSPKLSFASSSLSYATNRPEQPLPLQPRTMSRRNNDTGSVIAGGLGSALGGVLTGVWGSHNSATPTPVVENPPPGPATTGFESTLETIHDVEVPGGFDGEREKEVPFSSRELVPEPVVIPPSPSVLEEPEPLRVPTPNKTDHPEDKNMGNMSAGSTKFMECSQQGAGEAQQKAEKEAKERAEWEEKERAERAARETVRREVKEREEAEKAIASAPMVWSARGSTAGKSHRLRKTSALSQKEQRNEWAV